ncbi:hypothetical protein SAMD00019534_075920 [Acytostelium subglobosum LB1]|uniref:hypothetical protein n=1 Tax=Acytostelium subglobosum LB1 TaxID=1410327 RepID=UPI0006450819|nr:hypothetical protein SAMD00019534_075920 [Acytostelium subglobosum LB1]GAM24417.1 hypothetical protein SAMD00019534_075920 [Acytostelium subglobosum LB1]|eukprot:XP_012752743.1 hypothetical protein SAMD00019534_075920 [Acytostelium subglobosum LB1]
MSERSGFKKRKAAPKVSFKPEGDKVKEIVYDDHQRTDYLTGFHRRKKARREFAMERIAVKQKEEQREQKKLAKLQREAYRDSIIKAKRIGEGTVDEDDFDDDEEEDVQDGEDGDDDDQDQDGDGVTKKKKIISTSTAITETVQQEFMNDQNVITATISPLNFDDDDDENQNADGEDIEDDDEENEDDEDDKTKKMKNGNRQSTKEKTPKKNKYQLAREKKKAEETISSEQLTVFDASKKIFTDNRTGKKVMMKKEKGKLIPVVLSAAAENAMQQGWQLPRMLREKPKKSWSFTEARKSRKKTRKEGKGKPSAKAGKE